MAPLNGARVGLQDPAITPSLVPCDADKHRETLYQQATRRFRLDRYKIENILPCTPFQCDVMDCAADDGRLAFGHAVYEIPKHIDTQRLAAAWKEVVRQTPSLRTCTFTSESGDSCQIVLAAGLFSWLHATSLDVKESVIQDEAAAAMSGPRCNRYVILEDPSTNQRLLIWTFNHALVDHALRKRILRRVLAVYEGTQDPNPFEIHAQEVERVARFWQEHLAGLDASPFPPLPSPLVVPRPDAQAEHRISYSVLARQKWSSTTVCRAALAVLLSRYMDSPDVLFGVVTEQSHHLIDGPTRTVVPIRVFCTSDRPVSDVMGDITAHDHAVHQFQQAGLRNIRRTGEDGSAACGFQTVLLVRDGGASPEPNDQLHRIIEESDSFVPCTNRALLLDCQIVDESALLVARYDQSVIEPCQMARFLRQLGCLIQQFQSSAVDLPLVGQLEVVTQEDRAEIESWNSNQLHVHDTTIHDVISRRAVHDPDAAAVSAWDGEWTYAELDDVSSRLAAHIQCLDLEKGQVILPLCFEKSKWVVAAILAVLKAGRAFTLIDPNDPPARMVQVCRQTFATVALTSSKTHNTMCAVVDRCIVIDHDFLQSLSCDEGRFNSAVKPQDLAYAIFTSGSTGEPKGIMIEHQGFASCAIKFGPALGINHHTRALQFASCGFGACLLEIVATLLHGGCVCIPSDDDRMNDVPGYIKRSKVNWLFAAPSYLETFQPEDVSGLQTLVVGGEPMSASIRDTWAPRVQLVNGYGQSESSTICCVKKVSPCSLEPNNIGRAVGARSWIIDPKEPNQLAPIGCIGELVIESPGIARDYIIPLPPHKQPFLVETPAWYPTKRLPGGLKFYRTGDLARYAPDGSIVCLGRRDSQVKIRGQRIEISEVEARLRQQLPSHNMIVAEAVKRSDSSGSTTLIAFLIEPYKGGEESVYAVSAADPYILNYDATKGITAKLQQVLPKQSIPSYYICMKGLPRTATGKADRTTLRSIASKLLGEVAHNMASQPSEPFDSSATSLEAKLRELWLRALNLDSNSGDVKANFFELGGDSIAAIKMVNMARLAGIPLKVSDIFQNPTPAGLTNVITRASVAYTPIPAAASSGPFEQSFAQGRLWFLDQLEVGASWYLIPFGARMRGPLNIEALTSALLALEQRHETLRTTFEDQDGVGVQVVHANFFKELKVIDLPDEQNGCYLQLLEQEQTTPFNVTSEAGWRVSLIRLGEDDHILSIVMHHIISDGWSIDVLRRELAQFYAAALQGYDPLSVVSPLPINYRDFAAWQKLEEQEAENQRQLEYWTNQLTDCSPAEFLIDFPRPTILSGKAGSVPLTIDGELYEKLRGFCNLYEVTPFVVLLAAFRAAHYRLTGAEDSVIGAPIANRNRGELENIIGFFVNTLCMRTIVDSDHTFENLVKQVRSTATASFEHQDVPFERVVSAVLTGSRDVSRNPLAQLIFAVHSQQDLGKFELEGLESELVSNHVYTRFDVEVHLFQGASKLSGYMAFAQDLFKLENIQNVVSVFYQILRQGLDQPQTRVAVLPLTNGLPELRKNGLLQIARVEYPRDSSVVDIFRSEVAAHPEAVAVVDSSSLLTYTALDRYSDQIATWLRHRNMPAETLVGVLAPRSCETVVAIIGILKANLAYLPLDVKSPATRLNAILSAMPRDKLVLLGSNATVPEVGLSDLELVRIGDALEHPKTNGVNGVKGVNGVNGHKVAAALEPLPSSLAYVIFTSGSTGKPKGVMIEHRSVLRLVKETTITSKFPSAAKVAHVSNIAFDAAVWETFAALLNGGTLVCIDYMTTLDSNALEAVFAQEQINVALITPALLKHCLANIPATLRKLDVLVVGADRLDPQDAIATKALVRTGFFNAYGPTENGVISTIYTVAEDDSFINGVPIGQAINNSGAYIMDPHQQLVPAGVMGELVVTGDGLARGYTDSTLDAGRFVELTVNGEAVRAYRTGDRVRYRVGDGQIEFFGRMDQQLKIRGHRIEAAEVERAILSQRSVVDAVVVIRDQDGQEPEMVSFVMTEDDSSAEQHEAGNQVQGWQDFFEKNTYADMNAINPSAIGNDFTGWTSMYDGSEIEKAEMQEWLNDTISTLRDGQKPGRVLEIGTGSGMILFNLGSGLQSYVGLEPSKSAAAFVNKAIESIPDLAGKAEVHVGTATDTGRLSGLCPDLIVLNSVVQYFPTPEYLVRVVDSLVQTPGIKRLFFGDIRSYATNRHFLAARAIHALGNDATKDAVQQKMAELEERDEEMLVDPTSFKALQSRLPDRIKHVEIIPKNMRATNELSAYRYAAVIHIRGPEEQERPVHSIPKNNWIDFQASKMDRDALLVLLQRSADAKTVAVSNIPYSKTIFERHIVESLDNDSRDGAQSSLDGAAWISAVRADAERCASLDVPNLKQLGEETGFRVEVSAARQWSQHGALDAIFHRYDLPVQNGCRVLFRFPADDETRQMAALISRPLQRVQSRRFVLQIREQLQSVLPSYMIPSHMVVIDQMPVNANGKVDRKELTRRAQIIPKSRVTTKEVTKQGVVPLNEVEAMLCEEFENVFGTKVGTTDHFFKLGGHSLLATKLMSRISRRLNARIYIKDIFDNPVIADLAASIRRGLTCSDVMPTASHGGNEKQRQVVSAGVAPRNELEVVLCKEFAGVLGFEVGITDNFFELGGHSLMATKLAARIGHRLDTPVSVKDVFDHPVIVDLANKIGLAELDSYEAANDMENADHASFQLLSMEDPETFIQHEISPQLEWSNDMVLDVYPTTQMQRTFLHNRETGEPHPLTPFYVDFPADSDCARLARACTSLVEYVDIFRTVFLEAAGYLYQVVLKHLDLEVEIIETEENLNSSTAAFLDGDLKKPLLFGKPMIRIAILTKKASFMRVILRLSHALYDGLSLEHIVRTLHILYSGTVLPAPFKFSRYMQHMVNSRKDGYNFWRSVLKDSSITDMKIVSSEQDATVGDYRASKVINVPLQANADSRITPATIFTTACALALSKDSGSNDVVFGRIVSGRQGLPIRSQNIIGPCTNAVPVRARIDKHASQKDLLSEIQDQYISSLPFETLGFDDLKKNCTNWPEATANNFSCCVAYQHFDYHPDSQVDEQTVRMGVLLSRDSKVDNDAPIHDLAIAGEVDAEERTLHVTIIADRQVCAEARVNHILDDLCDRIQTLSLNL
ncbi:NRPS [Arachnomyces sp. PD_36]|nr:NRPS [Arachnomyces sp. PD_36]